MDRKEFLKTCGFACIGGTALAALLQGCGTANYYARANFVDNQIAVKKSEFIELSSGQSKQRKYVLVKNDKMGFPICIYKQSESEFTALYMQCTHKGCELNPHGDYLVCPCHGSEFTNRGVVQNPPAEENLKTFQIKTDNENIYVQL